MHRRNQEALAVDFSTGTGAIKPLLFLFLVIVVVLDSPAVDASPDPLAPPMSASALAYQVRGNRLYRIREFERAVEEYKAGALIENTPVFQYNLAQSYRMLGRYTEALWYYRQFVNRTHPSGELKSAIDQFTTQMTAALEKANQQNPSPKSAPTGDILEKAWLPRSEEGKRTSEHWYDDSVGWTVAASGSLITVAGIYLFLSARSLNSEALAPGLLDSERRAKQSRAQDREFAGYFVTGSGLSILVLGGIRLGLVATPSTPASVSLAGRF